jgi:type II secretory pathway pseudopilin PulG
VESEPVWLIYTLSFLLLRRMEMRKGVKGFTLVEVTIILLVLVILSGILLPTIERFIDLARYVKAKEDIGMFAAIIELWKVDNCTNWFKWYGEGGGHDCGTTESLSGGLCAQQLASPGSDNRLDLLVSDGDPRYIPSLDTGIHYWNTAVYGSRNTVTVDTMENQLVIGRPYGGGFYPRPDSSSPVSCGFRGAYISTPIGADPWGTRYMVNVAFLGFPGSRTLGATASTFRNMDVFVLSAGPDRTVSTPFTVDGAVARGDDMIALVSGGF